jgi:hypothetical protein
LHYKIGGTDLSGIALGNACGVNEMWPEVLQSDKGINLEPKLREHMEKTLGKPLGRPFVQ